jgi:hypothetical protein
MRYLALAHGPAFAKTVRSVTREPAAKFGSLASHLLFRRSVVIIIMMRTVLPSSALVIAAARFLGPSGAVPIHAAAPNGDVVPTFAWQTRHRHDRGSDRTNCSRRMDRTTDSGQDSQIRP